MENKQEIPPGSPAHTIDAHMILKMPLLNRWRFLIGKETRVSCHVDTDSEGNPLKAEFRVVVDYGKFTKALLWIRKRFPGTAKITKK